MNILGHAHHFEPFHEDYETLERRQLIARANDLASLCADKDRTIAHLQAQLAARPSERRRRWLRP